MKINDKRKMTLDEAIEEYKQLAIKSKEDEAVKFMSDEFKQIAEWLEELKDLKGERET